MDPATILALLNGAVGVARQAAAAIAKLRAEGLATVEQQAEAKAAIDTLRDDAAFTGPEWDAQTKPL